jgi:hypothetical protein
MKSRVLFLLAVLVGSANVSAQNLVPNGSFEEGIECPSVIGNLDAQCAHWFNSIAYPGSNAQNHTPEWYHACGELDVFIPPDVAFGYQVPFEGEGYAGVIIFNDQLGVEESYREPIGVELTEPLVEGSTYSIEFSIVRLYSQATSLAANNFGFKFTNTPTFSADSLIIDNTSFFKIDTIISDTTNWLTVSTEFVADSNYAYVHFGNFYDNDLTDFIADTEIGIYAYLALDAISVTEVLPTNTEMGHKKTDLSVFPNPTEKTVKIESDEEIITYSLYTLNGKLFANAHGNNQSLVEIDMEELPSGIYILQLSTQNSNYYEKIIKQ